jgi:hypothetical protein
MGTADELGQWTVGVVSLSLTFMRTRTHHCRALNMTAESARCVAKPLAKGASKMRLVAKAAGMCDRVQWLASLHRCAAPDKTRGVIQAHRINEVTAARTADREQLLQVA